jgi:hypothetical protein
VQYEFAEPRRVTSVAVYWFDDTGVGQCRVPAGCKLLYRDGTEWRPVPGADSIGLELDKLNRVKFEPITTSALRLEVQLQEQFSAGILEWQVEPE